MKKVLLSLALIILSYLGFAQNGLEGVIVEKYYISNAADAAGSVGALPSGSTTYRIYIELLPGYTFQAAYGVAGHELRFATTTAFFNNEDYGATTPNFSKNNARFNSVMLDSWFSGGAACALNHGILKTEDGVAGGTNVINADGILANTDPNAGIPLTTQDGFYTGTPGAVTVLGFTQPQLDVIDNISNAGNLISTFNASWAVLGGATGPTSANKILIAQFTTDGTFSFKLNLQLGTPVPGVSQNFVAENPVGSEILFPGLIYPATAPTASVSIVNTTPLPVCQGTAVTFTATPVNGGTTPAYQWKKNGGNVGTNSSTYTTSGLVNGDQITCVMTSSISGALNNPATSNAIAASINLLPAVPTVTTAGPTTYCSGANSCTLSTSSFSGLNYQWIKGSADVAGATGTSYIPTATTSNTYKVRVTTTAGCSKTSTATSITVNAAPAATIAVTGPTTFCKGANACTLTANAGTGLTYQWTKGSTGTPISSATGISYVPTATNKYYKVIVTNANGCSKTSSAKNITVNALPTATITAQGPTTFCNGDSVVLTANSGSGLTYQWIKGAASISGATLINYSAKTAGTYTVSVTNANGCVKVSSGKTVTVNCREGEIAAISGSVNVYPNPNRGTFTLNFSQQENTDANANLEIIDITGRVVYTESLELVEGKLNKEFNLEGQFSSGLYFVRLQMQNYEATTKLSVE